jgi:predicted double-glycine peptidase
MGHRFSAKTVRLVLLAAAFPLAAAAPGWSLQAGPGAKPFRSLAERRNEQVVRQQWDLSCGAAAIATLLSYQLGHPVSEHDVALAMLRRASPLLVRARLGFSLLDLKIYAATQGFGAAGFGQMTLADLDAMAPAIVPIRRYGFRHYVVYRGRRDDRVLIADPSFGNRTLPVETFEAAWANTIGFIVFDPAEPHPPNRMGAPAELFVFPGSQAERTAIVGVRTGGRP